MQMATAISIPTEAAEVFSYQSARSLGGGGGLEEGKGRPGAQRFSNTWAAAATVHSMVLSSCAVDKNPASNCDGAR